MLQEIEIKGIHKRRFFRERNRSYIKNEILEREIVGERYIKGEKNEH